GRGWVGSLRASIAASRPARRWLVAAAAVLVTLLFAGIRWPLRVSAESRLEPRELTVVHCPIDAPVESVFVHEGEWVERGRRVARLDARELDFSLARAKAQVAELEARLEMLERGPRPQDIEMARR